MKHCVKRTNKAMITLCLAGVLSTTPLWAQGEIHAANAGISAQSVTEAQLSKPAKQTLDKLYKKIPALKPATKEISTNQDDRETYRIIFRTIENKKATLYADAEIDRNSGTLLAFSIENPSAPETAPAPSEAIAKQKAEVFLKEMLGSSFGQYRLDKANVDHVSFTRYVNNIPVADGYVVGVNGSGSIRYLNAVNRATGINMDTTAFAKPVDVMTKAQAEKAMVSQLRLMYLPKGRSGADLKTYDLKYRDNFAVYLDAKTGKEVQTDTSYQRTLSPVIAVKPGGKKVMAKTPQEAVAALAEFGIDVKGAVMKPSSVPPEMLNAGEVEYEGKQGDKYLRITAVAGRVIGFNLADPNKRSEEAKLTKQEMQEKALVFLQTYLDEEVTELRIEEQTQRESQQMDPEVVFYRTHQGVAIANQGYTVAFNKATGEITGLKMSVTDGTETFADASKAISPEAAAAEYVKHKPLMLQYVFPQVNGKIQTTPVLVYTAENMNTVGMVDALTGAWTK